jgi:predicted HTH domain antitoxin
MNTVSIKIPEMTFTALGKTPKDIGREILVAAVVKWFELGKVSQGKGAEILELSRAEFLDVLSAYRVSAWQYSEEELDEELSLD